MQQLLNAELERIREALAEFDAYHFEADLCRRMELQKLSSVELGQRCGVSHTTVDKWRTGKARPNGKERLKELGMALGMQERELNHFLLCNGFPALYVKNPMDGAARLLLQRGVDASEIVGLYRELMNRLSLKPLGRKPEWEGMHTTVMSADFHAAAGACETGAWFERNRDYFICDEKLQFAGMKLARFVCCFLSEASIHKMVATGELPPSMEKLLYPILSGSSITVRFLRDKLIAFGLFANMTEEEIDFLLECMKLQPISLPETETDLAVLCALRSAHERYPYFEYENAQRVLKNLGYEEDRTELRENYEQKLGLLQSMIRYYERQEKTEEDRCFEREYTSYADKGIADFVRDLLAALLKSGELEHADAERLLELLERSGDAE